jgi:hypothetical protein
MKRRTTSQSQRRRRLQKRIIKPNLLLIRKRLSSLKKRRERLKRVNTRAVESPQRPVCLLLIFLSLPRLKIFRNFLRISTSRLLKLPEGKVFLYIYIYIKIYYLMPNLFIHLFSRYRSKGYGFVEAATVEDQQKILNEFKEVEFKERIITVKPLLSKGDDE